MLLGALLLTYMVTGIVVGCAFIVAGASRVVDGRPPISHAARLLLLPGAIVLWPLIARRWLAHVRSS